MFLRKVAARRYKKKQDRKLEATSDDEVPRVSVVEPVLFYDEPKSPSAVSSEVEYIEDDGNFERNNIETGTGAAGAVLNKDSAKSTRDELIALSVCFASNCINSDDGSCFSLEKRCTKLQRQKADKMRRFSDNIDAVTTMSEGHLTQATENTSSETCSTSMSSEVNEDKLKEKRRLVVWKQAMEEHIARVGTRNPQTATRLIELGTTFLQHEQFSKAREYFQRAVGVSEALFAPNDLRIAKALELYGIVEISNSTPKQQDQEHLQTALTCLHRAFSIRFEVQGPRHTDTVETLNRIARVQIKSRLFCEACKSYYEVLKMREAIFGHFHPSVAFSARALAIANSRLSKVDTARFYLTAALSIYEHCGLGRTTFADVLREDLHNLKLVKTRCEV